MTLEPWLRRHPLIGYFALAYGISWGGILIVLGATGFDLVELAAPGNGPHLLADAAGPEHEWTGSDGAAGWACRAAPAVAESDALAGGRALVRGRAAYDAVAPVRDPGALERLRGPGVRAPFPMAATAAVGSLFGTVV